jgi:hypothetical protein
MFRLLETASYPQATHTKQKLQLHLSIPSYVMFLVVYITSLYFNVFY